MAKLVKNVPAQRKTTEGQAAPPSQVKPAKPNPATPPKESKVKADPSAKCCPNPKWMDIALNEMKTKNTHEIKGSAKHNPNILKYAADNALKTTDDETYWCGAFVNWCLEQAGYSKSQRCTFPERSLAWARQTKHKDGWWPYGVKIGAKPIYGAIAVKDRKGGGHITFVAGKHPTLETQIICVGGNQADQVRPQAYDITDFNHFLVPSDYPYQCCGLKVWSEGKYFEKDGTAKET